MNRSAHTAWRLLAIGGATAVGLTTHDAGFTVLTFFGTLLLPRFLGLGGPRWHGACGGHHAKSWRFEERMGDWHREAHGESGSPRDPATVA